MRVCDAVVSMVRRGSEGPLSFGAEEWGSLRRGVEAACSTRDVAGEARECTCGAVA